MSFFFPFLSFSLSVLRSGWLLGTQELYWLSVLIEEDQTSVLFALLSFCLCRHPEGTPGSCWGWAPAENIACLQLRLLRQPGERLCCVRLCHDCCQKRINVSGVSLPPRTSFQPLSSCFAYPGFKNSKRIGAVSRMISDTGSEVWSRAEVLTVSNAVIWSSSWHYLFRNLFTVREKMKDNRLVMCFWLSSDQSP